MWEFARGRVPCGRNAPRDHFPHFQLYEISDLSFNSCSRASALRSLAANEARQNNYIRAMACINIFGLREFICDLYTIIIILPYYTIIKYNVRKIITLRQEAVAMIPPINVVH